MGEFKMKKIRRITKEDNWTIAVDDGYKSYADNVIISDKVSINDVFIIIKTLFKMLNPFIEIWWKIERKIKVYLFFRSLR
jgi:hypothetical protein